jgi:glutamate racemase
MDNRKIGIFDSGVGGLTVVSELSKQMPNEEIIYFGDTARNPYGTKNKDTITFFCKQIVRFLKTENVKFIVVACNTATITSLKQLQKEFDENIIGVVNTGILSAIETTQNKKIGIIGTASTIKSKLYEKKLKDHNPNIEVYQKSCPLLVQLIEEGFIGTELADEACKHYIDPLVQNDIDTLILACTHFPLHEKSILKAINQNIKIVDPAIKTIQTLKEILTKKNMLRLQDEQPKHEFYVSGNANKFNEIYNIINKKECNVKMLEIENY